MRPLAESRVALGVTYERALAWYDGPTVWTGRFDDHERALALWIDMRNDSERIYLTVEASARRVHLVERSLITMRQAFLYPERRRWFLSATDADAAWSVALDPAWLSDGGYYLHVNPRQRRRLGRRRRNGGMVKSRREPS